MGFLHRTATGVAASTLRRSGEKSFGSAARRVAERALHRRNALAQSPVPESTDPVKQPKDLDENLLKLRIVGAVAPLRIEQDPVRHLGSGQLLEKACEGRRWHLIIFPAVPEEEGGGVIAEVCEGREDP